MSQTAEHFASIDNQIALARAAWEKDRVELQDRIVKLELELDMHKRREREAIEGRITAEQRTAALSALFGVVRHVLEEAAQREAANLTSPTAAAEAQAAAEAAIAAASAGATS
jgi:hypothetical protein